ncbi:MAG: hypothetical protein HRT44_12090 [Bdellovibrionales bacterium]|nr:hypothetical protein [Bdellovibrionales bacterium]NQZ19979.1 hypothetical protein [Bdellovibrionales bacterium]
MRSILFSIITFSFLVAQAQPISSSKDWSAEKNIDTVLGKKGCVAETVYTDEANGDQWRLQVIKLMSSNGEHSAPVVMAYPEVATTTEYQEAEGQSNRAGTPVFSMTLFQPENVDVLSVGSRMGDRLEMVRRIKGDSTFTVKFMSQTDVVKEVEYSLRGSSRTIRDMDSACQ